MPTPKAKLRQALKQARLTMLDEEQRLASAAIVNRLKRVVDWSNINSLHYFEPVRGLLEPDISAHITYLEDTYPKLKLCTPRLIDGRWQLVAVHGGPPPDKFDVVIVPMLGFDPVSLHRIGYGGGYYDRFLATQPQAKKIGVCFELGKTRKIPVDPHDIPLDLVITETHTYSTGQPVTI